jgi:hypothetical protein
MKIKRVILCQPTTLANNFPTTLLDVGRNGIASMKLAPCGVEVVFDDTVFPVSIIPLSNITCLIPDRESPEDLVEALESHEPRRKAKR